MAAPAAETANSTDDNDDEDGPPQATVALQVRVADAQGLRLFRGGDIRLVITLRSIEDPEGGAFGLKVTPWQEVPQNCAPSWRPREAFFIVPAERCFSAEFVDSSHLHIALMQKGYTPPMGATPPPPAAPARRLGLLALKPEGLAAAFQGAVAAVQGAAGALPDRGECIGTLRLPLGRRLTVENSGGSEGLTWVQLVDPGEGAQKAKGSLLLELKTTHNHLTVPRPPTANGSPPLAGSAPGSSPPTGTGSPQPPTSGGSGDSASPGAEVPGSPDQAPVPGTTSSLPSEDGEELSDTASESGMESDFCAGRSQASTSTPGDGVESGIQRASGERSLERPLVERPLMLPPDRVGFTPQSRDRSGSIGWLSSGKAGSSPSSYDGHSEVNIFTINNPNASASGAGNGMLNKILRWSQKPTSRKSMEDRIRSALDPSIRKQKRGVRMWRRWHEVFCVLNEIEQRLAEIVVLLVQAAASMKQFANSHSMLNDCARLSAFLRDATLYFQSEAGIPKRLETHLDVLEHVAHKFRANSVTAPNEAGGQSELWKSCEDLQVDIAVLLESAQMNAHHALAEYKKMHCRLELLVTEYEPICRLELEVTRPAFLPMLTDDSAKQVTDASVPERAVDWALDFSQLVGNASAELQEYVRALDHSSRQVTACSKELRSSTLQLASEPTAV